MNDFATFASVWGVSTVILALVCYRFGLQAIPVLVTRRAMKAMRKRGVPLNVLVLRPMNDPHNCRIPMAIADALTSIAIYDLSRSPVRISATIPADSYWSLSLYAENTDNFFVINDLEVREQGLNLVDIVLKDKAQEYQPKEGDLVVTAPSMQGIILIRMIVPDQSDSTLVEHLVNIQERAVVTQVDSREDEANCVYRLLATTVHGETHVRIAHSEGAVEQLKREEYVDAISVRVMRTSQSVQ